MCLAPAANWSFALGLKKVLFYWNSLDYRRFISAFVHIFAQRKYRNYRQVGKKCAEREEDKSFYNSLSYNTDLTGNKVKKQ